MTIDLIGAFESYYAGNMAPNEITQLNFDFNTSPEVVIEAKDISLTQEEQKILDQFPNPQLNEPQLLIKAVEYDSSNPNVINIKGVKCDYKFLQAYAKRVFPENSPIYNDKYYKSGSIAALITTDSKTVIVERNDDWKLFSSFSGFLTLGSDNPAIDTATKEAEEEFFQYTNKIKLDYDNSKIQALSFRKGKISGTYGTAEFIVAIPVNCTSDELSKELNDKLTISKKPDGKPDHTGKYIVIDPKNISKKTFEINSDHGTKNLRENSYFLVDPIVQSVSKALKLPPPPFMNNKRLNDFVKRL